jgi:hypothetical protein
MRRSMEPMLTATGELELLDALEPPAFLYPLVTVFLLLDFEQRRCKSAEV